MMCSQEPLLFPLPVFENRFTSNELDELLSFFQPTAINDNNDTATDFDRELSPQPVSSNSGSDYPNRFLEETDEKKAKRKLSNRESARRSRWRKKTHLENLTAELNRLKDQNREYTNRLSLVLNRLRAVKIQNELMRFECVHLTQRHASLNRALQAVQYSQFKDKIVTNNTDFVDANGRFSSLQRHAY